MFARLTTAELTILEMAALKTKQEREAYAAVLNKLKGLLQTSQDKPDDLSQNDLDILLTNFANWEDQQNDINKDRINTLSRLAKSALDTMKVAASEEEFVHVTQTEKQQAKRQNNVTTKNLLQRLSLSPRKKNLALGKQRGFKKKLEETTEITSLYPTRVGGEAKSYSGAYDPGMGPYNEDNTFNETKEVAGAFNDIFQSMHNAQNSILVTGWTLSPTQVFAYMDNSFDPPLRRNTTLPKLFALKALEGKADIVLLIWKNIAPDFSKDTKTFMKVLKEEIKKLAEETAKVPGPYYGKEKELRKQMLGKIHARFTRTNLTYSDHAKMVIVDSSTLFTGGLDLTVNRPNTKIWQDCHRRIKGPVVKDTIDLFAKRFKRHSKIKMKYAKGVAVVEKALSNYKDTSSVNAENTEAEKLPTMQLLTSLRKEFVNMHGIHFNWKKGTHTTELMDSQVEAIKKAKNFIYMENQFFVGPKYTKDKNGNQITQEGPNKVIVAILNKIKKKIATGKPFHFYCQLPFRPEGKHDDPLVQKILREQWKTMNWMMEEIEKSIKDAGLSEKKVGDYVTFTNLGFYDPNKKTENGFEMKYTHSKLMIIDDKIDFIGSNNCNERSSKGNRDHEICIRRENDPEIGEYRERLMKQHFGEDCINKIKNLSPNHPDFYKAVKAQLDSNLDNKNNEPSSRPWGNVSFETLENRIKPPHVQSKTSKLLNVVGLSSVGKKFTR